MLTNTHSNIELEKFILEITNSDTALEIFKQLQEDGGNTIQGLIKNLNNKGIKIAKTKTYEEINNLVQKGLVNRISKRPPVYSINLAKENLEELSSKYFMDTRETLMRRWALIYPFLPEYLKQNESKESNLIGLPVVNFNSYPIVDVFNTDKEGLLRYILRVFESNVIYISNTVLDTCLSSSNFLGITHSGRNDALVKLLEKNYNRYGKIVLKTLSTVFTEKLTEIMKNQSFDSINFPFLKYFDYEIRKPLQPISSFVLTDTNIHFPIGTGESNQQTDLIIEIREPQILKNARIAFNKVWNTADPIFKVDSGKIIE